MGVIFEVIDIEHLVLLEILSDIVHDNKLSASLVRCVQCIMKSKCIGQTLMTDVYEVRKARLISISLLWGPQCNHSQGLM